MVQTAIDNNNFEVTLDTLNKLEDISEENNTKKSGTLLSFTTVSSIEEPVKLKKVSFELKIDIIYIESLKRYNKQNSFTEDFNEISDEQKCFCSII